MWNYQGRDASDWPTNAGLSCRVQIVGNCF